ncbi:hypothetical protein PS685_05064 [Pseudomonas fluorescens]|uniref:Uncharacterized protein n=1 Tax=Pseudomonas fluorescens TaxID=294 RepID=A0A5E7A685_PSEFL|nr:hypothetical protein PS685_05064 [Pseudomonas fluorescens]
MAFGDTLADGLFSRQELDGAIQLAAAFQIVHQALVFGNPLIGLARCQRNGLGLLVVVAQDQAAHLIGHAAQQLVTLLLGHIAGLHHFIEQDLDIHFVVRAVHTAGIIDKVGVGAAAIEVELDTAQLGHAQVAALAYHFAAQFVAVDA